MTINVLIAPQKASMLFTNVSIFEQQAIFYRCDRVNAFVGMIVSGLQVCSFSGVTAPLVIELVPRARFATTRSKAEEWPEDVEARVAADSLSSGSGALVWREFDGQFSRAQCAHRSSDCHRAYPRFKLRCYAKHVRTERETKKGTFSSQAKRVERVAIGIRVERKVPRKDPPGEARRERKRAPLQGKKKTEVF